ncbi:unnamed protein product [Sphenostylis stenocarpa]|uniref:Uncharacterized protein n=1 Tax=Sphenostylis stenocarpa TaxID=92480 RepID=A0AA86VVQ5_9FABA|nr:unnamed protein product [Sphenostylis stenocarpa]
MAESSPSTESKSQITVSDMEAAQHLIQLSEDSSSDNIAGKKRNRNCDGEEVHQRLSDKTATRKILEGQDEVSQSKKPKRFRSLEALPLSFTSLVLHLHDKTHEGFVELLRFCFLSMYQKVKRRKEDMGVERKKNGVKTN